MEFECTQSSIIMIAFIISYNCRRQKVPQLASYLRRYGGGTDLTEHEWREARGAETCREVWRVLCVVLEYRKRSLFSMKDALKGIESIGSFTRIIFYKGHREIQTMHAPYEKCTFMFCFWTKKC